jgi:hypothetical protein
VAKPAPDEHVCVRRIRPEGDVKAVSRKKLHLLTAAEYMNMCNQQDAARIGLGLKNRGMTC